MLEWWGGPKHLIVQRASDRSKDNSLLWNFGQQKVVQRKPFCNVLVLCCCRYCCCWFGRARLGGQTCTDTYHHIYPLGQSLGPNFGISFGFQGLAIGFCVVVGGFACGNVSGGSLNPAVSLALALSGGGLGNAMGNSEAGSGSMVTSSYCCYMCLSCFVLNVYLV